MVMVSLFILLLEGGGEITYDNPNSIYLICDSGPNGYDENTFTLIIPLLNINIIAKTVSSSSGEGSNRYNNIQFITTNLYNIQDLISKIANFVINKLVIINTINNSWNIVNFNNITIDNTKIYCNGIVYKDIIHSISINPDTLLVEIQIG